MNALMSETLLDEYGSIMADLGQDATDDQVVTALADRADWTAQGAREVLHLARGYGTSILRNALALAEVMRIEDGDVGL
jgi:hypothetical protein